MIFSVCKLPSLLSDSFLEAIATANHAWKYITQRNIKMKEMLHVKRVLLQFTSQNKKKKKRE